MLCFGGAFCDRVLGSCQMRSSPEKFSPRVKKEENDTLQGPIDVSSSPSSSSEDGSLETEDEDGQSNENASKQLVLYDPSANGTGAIEPVPDPIQSHPLPFRRCLAQNSSSRVLPSVGAFTVQCAKCFKWRLIPTKEKSCDDPADISQDGSRLWAIDKPNIAQPPPGWQRLLRIRGEGSTKFADMYVFLPI